MMSALLLFAVSSITPPLAGGLIDDLRPELSAFSTQFVHYREGGLVVISSQFKREDRASLSVSTATYPSANERRSSVSEFRKRTSAFVRPDSQARTQNLGFSGLPLGDVVGRSVDPGSKLVVFNAGAELSRVHIQLMYRGTGAPGQIVWEVGDETQDRQLVEDIARRVLGRMLAWQHVQAVRDRTLASGATEVTDSAGKRFVSVASWVAASGGSSTAERSVGRRFTHNGRAILVLTGADKIKVGNQWVGLGGYVMEVNNKPFVPLQGFLAALR